MKSAPKVSDGTPRFFGSITVYPNQDRRKRRIRVNRGRLCGVVLAFGALFYSVAVTGGFVWLRHFRNLSQVSVMDVALVRWKSVRRDIASRQFARAREEWRLAQYQAAYLSFMTALRNDPSDVAGRLDAAKFLISANVNDQAILILEEGLKRHRDNIELIKTTFDYLTTSTRDDEALKLLQGIMRAEMNSINGPLLRTYEMLATFNIGGVSAARRFAELHPEINQCPLSDRVRARVLWESRQRFDAIQVLAQAVKEQPYDYANYALLAQYQEATGMAYDARETAALACKNLPSEIGPRIILIGTLDPSRPDEARAWREAILVFLHDFRDNQQGIASLAEVAGRKGWSDFLLSIYESEISRGNDVHLLAIYYCDALIKNQLFRAAQQVLENLTLQLPASVPYTVLLWDRKILVDSALGASEEALNTAHRLGDALRQDPPKLESYRRRYKQLGLLQAAAALNVASKGSEVASRP